MGFHIVAVRPDLEVVLGNIGSDSTMLRLARVSAGPFGDRVADILLSFPALIDLRGALALAAAVQPVGLNIPAMSKGELVAVANADGAVLTITCNADRKDEKIVVPVPVSPEEAAGLRDAVDLRLAEIREVKLMDLAAFDPKKESSALKALSALLARLAFLPAAR